MNRKTGKALIFVGPSGSGKTTILKHLLDYSPMTSFSVSACTRPKRPQEVHGKDYNFLSEQEFQDKIDQGAFVEWHEVYKGQYYGTLKSELERIWSERKIAIVDMDVLGGLELKKYLGERALSIYVSAPSLPELSARLIRRGTDSRESIAVRMAVAQKEMGLAPRFDCILVNRYLSHSFLYVEKILESFL